MSDEKLIATYDSIAQHTGVGTQFYPDELVRREAARTGQRMLDLIVQIRWLTVAVTAATIIALAISVVALLE
jgi:hypothetical protein